MHRAHVMSAGRAFGDIARVAMKRKTDVAGRRRLLCDVAIEIPALEVCIRYYVGGQYISAIQTLSLIVVIV
jgi:hypothetical protein